MRIRLSANHIELSGELRDYIARRVQFAFGRFARRIRAVSVRVTDVNGPRGGWDKTCLVAVDAGLAVPVTVVERSRSVQAAVALAVERAGRAVTRQTERQRKGTMGGRAAPAGTR
jgi:putative sigma-54 modulation protein